jgi:hypothetical protein
MLMQDTAEDFYPPNTGRFQSYQSASPTDASPQASTIPISIAGMRAPGGLSGALDPKSPWLWGLLMLGGYLFLMHVV